MDFNGINYTNYDILLICGLPSSGKSYFAKKYFSESGRKRINRSEIRKMLFEMTNFGKNWSETNFIEEDEVLIKHVEKKIIEHLVHNKKKILIDNTSVTRLSRKYYVDIAKANNKSIAVIFINTPVIKCIERNRMRADKKPENVISQLYSKIELPEKKEGFNFTEIIEG
ncbi:MAG: AAA family ATPase [Spirochaetes bacterium]|nr:AAA family ATPase [Spirochaetota bacterium]